MCPEVLFLLIKCDISLNDSNDGLQCPGKQPGQTTLAE